MIGIRGIELSDKDNWQTSWFKSLDILLTGAILAGGSDFIHKILQMARTFMEIISTANKSTEASNKANVAAEKTKEIANKADAAEHLNRLNGALEKSNS